MNTKVIFSVNIYTYQNEFKYRMIADLGILIRSMNYNKRQLFRHK